MNPNFFTKYFDEHRREIETSYCEFLRFPTISSDPSFLPHMRACAQWLARRLIAAGCTVEQWETNGVPIIYGSIRCSKASAPTVLIYNHYDVQPVDPIDEWTSPPFDPRIENGTVYARGAQDNKGQCMYSLLALQGLQASGSLPCHIKYIIEGEEENGSASLINIIERKRKELSADYTMVIDAGMRKKDTPAINLGTRGLVALTMKIIGANQDLHSGVEGGLAYNPLHAMVALLSSLRRPDGSIAVPGFYDEVRMPSSDELSLLAQTFDEKEWEKQFGQSPTGGETQYPPLVRNWLRPTLEINGIHGGYGGPGSKTVIPKEAIAKITCRLVPDQDPLTTAQKVQKYLLSLAPRGVTVEVSIHEGMGRATRASSNVKGIQALKKALEFTFGTQPEYILDGASIPIISLLHKVSGGEIITWGMGLETDHIHAPNERFDFERMRRGFTALCMALGFIGE